MTSGDPSTDLIRGALAWLATYAVHSTLFLGVAWALAATRRPRVNRNRERVWKLALIGGVVSATLQCGLGARAPFGHVEWNGPEPVVARVEREPAAEPRSRTSPGREPDGEPVGVDAVPARSAPAPLARVEPVSAPRAPRESSTALHRSEAPPKVSREQVLTEPRPERPRTTRPLAPVANVDRLADALRARWPNWVLGAWTTAGLLGLVGFALSWAALRRHLLGRELLREGPLIEILARLCAKAGVTRRIRLSVSTRIASPFSTGWLRPEICLPRAVASALSPGQQEALLAHELAHLVRRDPAWFALSSLFERLFFFQPLNRLARRNLSELAEVACDDWAVRWTGARLALASCLTEVAGWVVGERPRAFAPPGLAGSPSRLGRRIQRLLDDRRSPAGEPPTPWWPPIAAGALAVAVLAVPGVSAQKPRAGEERASRAPRTRAAESEHENRVGRAASRPEPREPEPESAEASAPDLSIDPASIEHDVLHQRELESELTLLEAELGALQAELAARDLDERFDRALTELRAQLEALRHQHARAQALLERLATPEPLAIPEPPTGGPQPPAAGPAPTEPPGEPR